MAQPHLIRVYRDSQGRFRWSRKAGNHRVVASSEQGFRTRYYAKRDALRDVPAGIEYQLVIDD